VQTGTHIRWHGKSGDPPVVKAPKEHSVNAIPAFGPIVAAALPPASKLKMIGTAENAETVLKRLRFCNIEGKPQLTFCHGPPVEQIFGPSQRGIVTKHFCSEPHKKNSSSRELQSTIAQNFPCQKQMPALLPERRMAKKMYIPAMLLSKLHQAYL
jgi:hypothetical protein